MLVQAPPPRATRPAQGFARHPAIDALRGAAILCVVLRHMQIHIPQEQSLLGKILPAPLFNLLFHSGYYGAIIFFVISGFLITRTSIQRWGRLETIPCTGFLWRRGARLYPCLLLVSLLLGLHQAGLPDFIISDASPGQAAADALAFRLNGLDANVGHLPPTWNLLWSLSLEQAFYLAFPLLCLLSRQVSRHALALTLLLVMMLGPFVRALSGDDEIRALHGYLSGMGGIAIGCLAALYAARPASHMSHHRTLLLIGTVLFVLVFFLRQATATLGLTALGLHITALEIGVACLLLGWSLRPHSARPALLAPLRWAGRNSYEISLTHMFPVWLLAAASCRSSGGVVATWWRAGALTAAGVLAILLSAVLGGLVARWFSSPMRRWLNHIGPRTTR